MTRTFPRAVLIATLTGLAALGLALPASAQSGDLGVCVELTNDADGDRSFTDSSTIDAAGDVAHQVEIENCGDWDSLVEVSIASVGGGEVTVCSDVEGELLVVDAVINCEFELPIQGSSGDAVTTTVTVSVVASGGVDRGTATGSDDTTIMIGAAAAPSPTPTPTETETESGAAAATDDLAETGPLSVPLLAASLALLLFGLVVVDAGRRTHVLQPAVARHALHRGEHNPMLRVAISVSRQVRWWKRDLLNPN